MNKLRFSSLFTIIFFFQITSTVIEAKCNETESVVTQNIFIFLPNGIFETVGHDINIKFLLPDVKQLLEKKFSDKSVNISQLSEEETKISTNHYLGYCMDPWGGYLKVIKDRKISLENEIFIVTYYLPNKDKSDVLEIEIYHHIKGNDFPKEFSRIFGRRFSNIKPSDNEILTIRVAELIKEKINIILKT